MGVLGMIGVGLELTRGESRSSLEATQTSRQETEGDRLFSRHH